MIAQIGKVLFAQERISKFKKISNISFIAGIILLILYPFLSDNIFIVEKQLKFSEGFTIFQDKENFFKNSKEFNEKYNEWFKTKIENKKLYVDFNNKQNRKALFSEHIIELLSKINNPNTIFRKCEINIKENLNEIINSFQIRSQRGDFSKAIIVNFIYDSDKNPSENSFHLVFAFLKNFENKKFYNWMSKDLFFNFISKDLFYYQPKKLVNFLKDDPFINEIFPEFFINIDLTNLSNTFTRSSFFDIFLKINGVDSENIDMDYYKLFFDNFNKILNDNYSSNQFSIKTFENKFGLFSNERFKNTINNIKNDFLNKLSSIIDTNSIKNSVVYRDLHEFYSYLLHNIFENYLNFEREISANDVLISEGKISILIKIVSDSHKRFKNENDFYLVKSYDNKMINLGFNVFCVFERALKNLNKVEIDIFRGDHNYILTKNNKFQGTGLFILIPVLCVIRIFYELLQKIYEINDIENEIFDGVIIKNKNFQNFPLQEIESNLKSIFLKDKLANFASFQLFVVLFITCFLHLSELLNAILNNKDHELFKNVLNEFSRLIPNISDKKNVCCVLILFLFVFLNLIKIVLKKIFVRNNSQLLNSQFNSSLATDDFVINISSARKNVDNEITNITNLLYLGLNLFLIFFINYSLGFVSIAFLMIPVFISINIESLLQSILTKKTNENLIKTASFRVTLVNKIIGLLTFVPIFLIFYMDSSFEIIDYFIKILLNEDTNNNILKFLYLDIIIFYCLKIQKLFDV